MFDVAQSKRKLSVTIDEDLVAALEASGGSLSSQVNEAIRGVVEHRERQVALRSWLDEMTGRLGPPDEAEVQRFIDLLT
jgi:hypothetical protein